MFDSKTLILAVALAAAACTGSPADPTGPADPSDPADPATPDPTMPDPTTPDPTTPDDTDTDTGGTPVTAPSVVATLMPDTVVQGDALELHVALEGYTLVDPTAVPPPEPAEGEGHFHIEYDGVYIGAAWEEVVGLQTSADEVLGAHELRVVLVNSVHEELDPVVDSVVTLTVEE